MKKKHWGLWAYGVVVTALIVMAIIQLNDFLQLWTRRGGEVEPNPSTVVHELDQAAGVIRPLRIYASSGEQPGRLCLVNDQTAHYIHLYEGSWYFLQEALDPGCEVETILIQDLAEEKACRYTYGTILDTQMLGDKVGWFYSGNFQFQEIWMAPAESVREKACVYLVNYDQGNVLQITSEAVQWQSEVNSHLLDLMERICETLGEYYISSSYAYPGYFAHNLYLRDQKEYEVWTPWRIKRDEGYNEVICRNAAQHFFERPELMHSEFYSGQGWIFTDDSCSVRIKENQVLDYVHTPSAVLNQLSAAEAYDVAYAFLLEDMLGDEILVGTYLENYEVTDLGYCFYWNYKIEDRVVVPDETMMAEEGMQSAIEIEVRGDQVYRYRKWRIQPEYSNYRVLVIKDSTMDVLNRMELRGCESLEKVYRMEENQAVLYWKVVSEGKTYYEKVM